MTSDSGFNVPVEQATPIAFITFWFFVLTLITMNTSNGPGIRCNDHKSVGWQKIIMGEYMRKKVKKKTFNLVQSSSYEKTCFSP